MRKILFLALFLMLIVGCTQEVMMEEDAMMEDSTMIENEAMGGNEGMMEA